MAYEDTFKQHTNLLTSNLHLQTFSQEKFPCLGTDELALQ